MRRTKDDEGSGEKQDAFTDTSAIARVSSAETVVCPGVEERGESWSIVRYCIVPAARRCASLRLRCFRRAGASKAPLTIPARKSSGLRPGAVAAIAFAVFAVVDFAAFRTSFYRSLLDPNSSTGSFEAAIDQFRDLRSDRRTDVLVLGDSRIYSGLDPSAASAASGRLRFLNGGVPGTTPRCWPFFVRAIDPDVNRLRAVVIPVDTYGDDDSAIGSLDGDDRPMDLRYVVFQTRLSDLPKLAGSFSDPRERVEYGIDLFWRAVELRDDFQAFAANPAARLTMLARPPPVSPYDPLGWHPRTETLAGLRVDFATNSIVYPAGMPDDQRQAIATQVLTIPKPSPSYAEYRRQWLGPIAAEYRAAGVPVIFVRIPTRPAHRNATDVPTGSLPDIARRHRGDAASRRTVSRARAAGSLCRRGSSQSRRQPAIQPAPGQRRSTRTCVTRHCHPEQLPERGACRRAARTPPCHPEWRAKPCHPE